MMHRLWLMLCLFLLVPVEIGAVELYRDVMLDPEGNAISGVAITVYVVDASGNTSLATIYSDENGAVTQANPTLSGAFGEFQFYLPDGDYSITFSKANYSFINVDRVSVYAPLGENRVTVAKYGTTDLCAATGAIQAIGVTPVTLVINRAMSCSVSRTIPATLPIEVVYPGKITMAAGQTLTIQSAVTAPTVQIFYGAGTVVLTNSTNPVQHDIWSGVVGAGLKLAPYTFATLPAAATNGTIVYCSDCALTNPCTGGSTGSFPQRLNGGWTCDGGGSIGVTLIEKKYFEGAGCDGATPGTAWHLPVATPAVPVCVTGANTQKAALQFADTAGGFSAQYTYLLPGDLTGALDARIVWNTAATAGNAKFALSTICTAVDGTETDDPAFNAASTVTTAAPGTTLRLQTSAITGLTATGCAAGEFLHLKLFRDGNDAADTIAASLNVIGVELTMRRAL